MSETASSAPATTAAPTETTSTPAERASPGTPSRAAQSTQAKAPESNEPKAPAQPSAPKHYDVKVNGKTIRMTEAEALQYASLGHVSTQRFQEAAQLKKQAESVIGKFRDPEKVIESLMDPALGLSKDQIRDAFEKWYAKEYIEPESLTPEQKKLRDYEAKLQKYADDEKSREQQKQEADHEAMTSQAREEIQKEILSALDNGALPRTNFSLQRLAHWIKVNRANGFNAPTEVLVGQVRNEFNNTLRSMVQESDGEVLIKLFDGTDIINKVRKYDLEQLRKLRGGGNAPAPQQESSPSSPQDRKRAPTSAEVTQRLRQLQRTGRY